MTALRIRARDLMTDQELIEVRTRATWKGMAMIVHAWTLIFGAIALVAIWPNPLTFILAVAIMGGLVVLRQLAKLNVVPLAQTPVFWLVCLCWVLGFKVSRFWDDWGWPALMVLMTCDLQALLQARIAPDSFKRLGLTLGLAAATFLCITNDAHSRWTQTLSNGYLTAGNPDLNGWLPDHGGIIYDAAMTLFYQTFFKNPRGDWRYDLGFEPTFMKHDDFEIYCNVLWNSGDAKAYKPWVEKMKPADRLVIRSGRNAPPNIPEL